MLAGASQATTSRSPGPLLLTQARHILGPLAGMPGSCNQPEAPGRNVLESKPGPARAAGSQWVEPQGQRAHLFASPSTPRRNSRMNPRYYSKQGTVSARDQTSEGPSEAGPSGFTSAADAEAWALSSLTGRH